MEPRKTDSNLIVTVNALMPIWGRACKWRPNLLTVSCKTCIAILYQRCSNLFMSRSSLQKCIPYLASNLHLEILCIYNIVIYSKIFKKVHNLSKYKYTFSFSYWYFYLNSINVFFSLTTLLIHYTENTFELQTISFAWAVCYYPYALSILVFWLIDWNT